MRRVSAGIQPLLQIESLSVALVEPRLAIIVAIIVIEYRVSDRYSNDTSPHLKENESLIIFIRE